MKADNVQIKKRGQLPLPAMVQTRKTKATIPTTTTHDR